MFINTHYPSYETFEMMEDDEKFSKQITGNTVLHITSITAYALIFGVFTFFLEWDLLTFVYNLGSTLSIFLISCIGLKFLNKKMDSANETGMLDVCKRDYKIGYGGISMIIIGSHVALLAVEANFYTYAYITWVAAYSISILFFIFVLPSTHHSYISPHTDLPCYSHSIQYIYWIVSIILNFCFREDNPLLCYRWCKDFDPLICDRCEELSMRNAVTCVLLASHMIILLNSFYAITYLHNVVFKDQVYLLGARVVGQLNNGRVAGKRMKKKKVIVVESSESEESDGEGGDQRSYNDLKCNVCMLKYNATSKNRSPRVLTNCGHTVCFGCIKNLTASRKVVRCPFCKKRTNLPNAAVNKLRKNYAIIGLIQEMNREKNDISQLP